MSEKHKEKKKNRWPLTAFLLAVSLSAVMSFGSTSVMDGAGWLIAVAVLLFFVGLGIVFDMIGVAVTAADQKPFHSMAAHKEKGGREAIRLLSNADHVASFCNDVVGDICGIVSGATAAVIVIELEKSFSLSSAFISLGVTAVISGLTIGGKALGKRTAIRESTKIVYRVACILHMLGIYKK